LPDERPVSQRRLAILIGRLLVALKDADRNAIAPLERLGQGRLDVRRVVALFGFELDEKDQRPFLIDHLFLLYQAHA